MGVGNLHASPGLGELGCRPGGRRSAGGLQRPGQAGPEYDGSVVAWGWAGGRLHDLPVAAAASSGVVELDSSAEGWVALKGDGSVVDHTGATRVAAGSGITDVELTTHQGIGLRNGGVVAWHNMWDAVAPYAENPGFPAGQDYHGILSVPASVSSPGPGSPRSARATTRRTP